MASDSSMLRAGSTLPPGRTGGLSALWRIAARDDQNRNTSYLTLNTVLGAAMGLAFWLFVTRWPAVTTADIGTGYAIIALGTLVGVVSKGGLDTALMRHVPGASRPHAAHMLRLSLAVGVGVAVVLVAGLGLAAHYVPVLPHLGVFNWVIIATMAALFIVTWLQDAYYMGLGSARPTLQRNIVVGVARVIIIIPLVALTWLEPVAFTWLIAVAVSALAASTMGRTIARRPARADDVRVADSTFLMSAARNVTSGAAELAPGLVLAPLVLAVAGPASAGYFAMAWAAASILFLAAVAISRSALVELVRGDAIAQARVVRRGLWQELILLAPAAIFGMLLAPQLLAVFGPDYAREAGTTLIILFASTLLVGPGFLYLAVLRAREETVALVALPLAMIAILVLLAPPLLSMWGIRGVALAWLAANVPMGLLAAWRLPWRLPKEGDAHVN